MELRACMRDTGGISCACANSVADSLACCLQYGACSGVRWRLGWWRTSFTRVRVQPRAHVRHPAHRAVTGDGFAHLLLWTSLTLNGTFNFVVPLLMYIRACTWTGASAVARKHASINSTLVRPPRGSAVPWTVDENEVMSLLPHAGGAAAMRGMTDEPDRGGACCPLDRRKRLATWLVVLYCFLLGVQAALIVLYMGLLGEGFFTRNPELASSIVIV